MSQCVKQQFSSLLEANTPLPNLAYDLEVTPEI